MNFENTDQQSMLFALEELSCIYSPKEDLLEKATNHQPEHKHYYFQHVLENSPSRRSFFTLTSPKPLHFQLTIDSSHPVHRTVPQTHRHAISKRLNLAEEEQENESPSAEAVLKHIRSPGRNSKDLKLSTTKYKEVADKLINDIITEKEGTGNRRKDEHNVKRRVYDALDVLIAAGLLRKEGKDVVCNERLGWEEPLPAQGKKKTRSRTADKDGIYRKKAREARQTAKKQNLILYILDRNRVQPRSEKHLLRFPLIGILVPNPRPYFFKNFGHSVIQVRLRGQVRLYGDVDLLLQINKEKTEMDSLLNNICCPVEHECRMEDL